MFFKRGGVKEGDMDILQLFSDIELDTQDSWNTLDEILNKYAVGDLQLPATYTAFAQEIMSFVGPRRVAERGDTVRYLIERVVHYLCTHQPDQRFEEYFINSLSLEEEIPFT